MPKLKEQFDFAIEKAAAGYSKLVNTLSLDTKSSSEKLKLKSTTASANALIVTLFVVSAVGCLALLSIALSGLSSASMLAKSLSDVLFDLTANLGWYVVPVTGIYAAKPYLELKIAERRELKGIEAPAALVRQTAVSIDHGSNISYPAVPTLMSQPAEGLANSAATVTPPGSPSKPRVIY